MRAAATFGKRRVGPRRNAIEGGVNALAHAIRISDVGGPEVMEWVDLDVPAPGPGEARVRHRAIGVNFIDTYQRKGLYKLPLPFVLGNEGAGVVEEIGPDVTEVKVGDRVAYQGVIGSYAEVRIVPSARLTRIPDGIDDKIAAAACLKGLTAYYLLRRTFKVEKGNTILFHAAAGGVGQIACQWAKALGATVIGTVGSDEKLELAQENGCAHVINYRTEDFVARVKEITGGEGVDVVYDAVGKDTFPGSLDCLRELGMWVSFGQSSGVPPPFPVLLLLEKGSIFATRPSTAHYLRKRAALETAADELFGVLGDGTVMIKIGQEFPLRDAAEAHRALEGRKTVGPTVLIP
jgi:NADPH:quinone reductase